MTTQLNIARDPSSIPTFITPFSDQHPSLQLVGSGVDADVPVPTDARFAVISYSVGVDIFVHSAVIVLPSNDTPVQTAGTLLKPSVDVTNITDLHFNSNDTAFVSIEFWT